MKKAMIPCLYLQSGQAVTGFGQRNLFRGGDVLATCRFLQGNRRGRASDLLTFLPGMRSMTAPSEKIKEVCLEAEIPVIAAGNIKRLEDVKKLIYAGCSKGIPEFFQRRATLRFLKKPQAFRKRKNAGEYF